MDTNKIKEIEDSLTNGQYKQFINQIRSYGVRKFRLDYMDFAKERYRSPLIRWAHVVYKYDTLRFYD